MRSGNPALGSSTFDKFGPGSLAPGETMTIDGTVNKAGLLLVMVLAPAFYVWRLFFNSDNPAVVLPWMWAGIIGGLIACLVTVFKKEWAGVSAPVYALFEGLALGGISAFWEVRFPGIVIQAVGLTFGVLFALLMAYKSRLIPVTENFKLGVVAATGGIFLVYLASFILGFFNIHLGFIHEGGIVGILFSVFVVVVASLNLVLDFDFIETGAQRGVPKYMEWYGAFGLMVTLIWLYLEMLRLLGKIRGRK